MSIKLKSVFAVFFTVTLIDYTFVQAGEIIDQPVVIVNSTPITAQAVAERSDLIKRHQSVQLSHEEIVHGLIMEELMLQIADRQGRGLHSPFMQRLIVERIRSGEMPADVARNPKKMREVVFALIQQSLEAMVMQQLGNAITEKEILEQADNLPDEFKQIDPVHYQLETLFIPIASAKSALQYVRYKMLGILKFRPFNRIQQRQVVSLQDIQLARGQAEEALAMIQQGKTFDQVINMQKGKKLWKKGRSVGTIDQLPGAYTKGIEQLKLGEAVGPFEFEDGFRLVRLVKITGPFAVQARHILLKPERAADAEKIKQRLLGIRESCMTGKSDFRQQVKMYSEDPHTVFQGGNLGWILPGSLEKSLEEKVFALEVGEITQPIETNQGWCVIQLVGKQFLTPDHPVWKRHIAKHYLEQREAIKMIDAMKKGIYADAYIQWGSPNRKGEVERQQ